MSKKNLSKGTTVTWSEASPTGIVHIVGEVSEENFGQKYLECKVTRIGPDILDSEKQFSVPVPAKTLQEFIEASTKDLPTDGTPFKRIIKKIKK